MVRKFTIKPEQKLIPTNEVAKMLRADGIKCKAV